MRYTSGVKVDVLTPVQAAVLVLDGLGISGPRREVLLALSAAAERTIRLRAVRKVGARARGGIWRVRKIYRVSGKRTNRPVAEMRPRLLVQMRGG